MSIEAFLQKVRDGERVAFQDTLSVIAENYEYTPTAFRNGGGEDCVVNEAGKNEGSCKIFAFARLHALTPEQTLALFGDFYWKDVLEDPEGTGHANIRAFMKYGWEGIAFEGEALRA
ncbi:HopJ type III effector protein [Methyloterricola oryzae]|uniref:HopJ type III effector protein n=1 Tax=Methyloterricola oryzae TaxID=1495050 RepID=UPI0005EBE001|nr:HopJ type III effector protein [Methyloterricola oryzae]